MAGSWGLGAEQGGLVSLSQASTPGPGGPPGLKASLSQGPACLPDEIGWRLPATLGSPHLPFPSPSHGCQDQLRALRLSAGVGAARGSPRSVPAQSEVLEAIGQAQRPRTPW